MDFSRLLLLKDVDLTTGVDSDIYRCGSNGVDSDVVDNSMKVDSHHRKSRRSQKVGARTYLLRKDVDLPDHDALIPVEEDDAVGSLHAQTGPSEEPLRRRYWGAKRVLGAGGTMGVCRRKMPMKHVHETCPTNVSMR